MAKKAVTETVADEASKTNKNLTKNARLLVQAQSMRLQLEKIEAECKAAILSDMEADGLEMLTIKTTMNGRALTLHASVNRTNTTVVDTEKLATLISPEDFLRCATVSLKAAKEILPSALIDKCSSTKQGNPTLKLKAEGSVVVPDLQFY
jgi:hypothetical protein